MEESKGALVPSPCSEHLRHAPLGQWVPDATAEQLDRLADDLDQDSIAKNTRKSYLSDGASWVAFCGHRIKPIPAEPADVRRYLAQLGAVEGRKGAKLKPRTAQRHLASIAAAHRAAGLEFDTQHPILKRTMSGILRRYGARQEGARALRARDIAAICASFGPGLRSVRNKAIILLGFAGGFRRSEIVALNVNDLVFEEGLVRVILRRSKADRQGHGRTIVVMPGEYSRTRPVAAVRAWLEEAELEHQGDNAAFRPVSLSGVESTCLSDKTVDRIVKSAARAAGLKESYSAHKSARGACDRSACAGR
jgi:site-specific recombinase XerD